MKEIKKGKYRHYKGNLYEIKGVVINSETLEEMVVYKGLYKSQDFGDFPVWVRPLKMFFDKVKVDGKTIPRFKYIGK